MLKGRPSQVAVSHQGAGTGGAVARASVEAFALELAGYPKVKVFMPGWEKWGADPDAPVADK
jgi:3-mercaptopyruvate sulfurtransferase SseA